MANKLTNLDVTVMSLGGDTSWIDVITDAQFDANVLTDVCRAITERYDSEIPVKKEFTWSCDMIPHVAAVCQSNLNASVWSFDGTSYLGEINSCELSVTTEKKFSDGVADLFRWPQALTTKYEVTAEKFITDNADFMEIALANNITSVQAVLIITAGSGLSITLPVTLTAASHSIKSGSLQMENVTIKNNGTPTSVSGDTMMVEIMTGDAYLAWAADSGGSQYSGNAILDSARFKIDNGALIKSSFTFANQGRPSFTAA
ncbi:MAG: hypothetical protein IT203_02605 [Fimbriimonadaceae bacterium]|nr:hypothetical protein [Fimbriimonadaceae bacterium]